MTSALGSHDFFDAAPDAVLLVNIEGKIVYANDLAHVVFGFDPGTLEGEAVDRLIPDTTRANHRELRRGYQRNPRRRSMSSLESQVLGLRRDGVTFPAEVSLGSVGSGSEMLVMAAVRDITERIRSDVETMAARLALDSVEDGVFVFDGPQSNLTYVNNGARIQTGYTTHQLRGMFPLDLIVDLDPSRFSEVLDDLSTGAIGSYTATVSLKRIDQIAHPVEILLHHVESPNRLAKGFFIAVARDISARLVAEETIRASEAAFRAAFDGAPVAMMITDLADPDPRRVLDVNDAMCELLIRSRDDLVGRTVDEITFADDRVSSEEHARQAREGLFSVEKRYIDGNGDPVWCAVNATNIDSDLGSPYRLAHALDIRQRVEAEAERDRREKFLSNLGDIRMLLLSECPMSEIDAGICQSVLKLFPGVAARIISSDEKVHDLLPGIHRVEAPLVVRGEVERVLVVEGPDVDVDDDPEVPKMIEALANEGALAAQLSRSRQDRRQLYTVEDRERIGRDLHDVVIQRLLAIGMRLQAARDSDVLSERVAETVAGLDETIDVIRETIFRLSTSEAELQTDVQTLVHSFRSDEGPSVALNLTGDLASVPERMTDHLLPVVNELMSNAVRHSGASHVEVDLEAVADFEVCLRVVDDGAGFLSRRRSGLGLDNIEARAESLGGDVEIKSTRGEGSTIIWRVPLSSTNSDDDPDVS